jgi:ribosomal protein L29
VPTSRVTLVDVTAPLAGEAAGESWLAQAGEEEIGQGLRELNRALAAYRVAAEDPYVRPVRRTDTLVARLGFGAGEEVAFGQWRQARELTAPPQRRRRAQVLEPQARMAAILGGRQPALAAEELALRVSLDLEQAHERVAALGLMVALDAALAELASSDASTALAGRLSELRGDIDPVASAAQSALAGPLSPAERSDVTEALERLQAALRARAATGEA